MRALRDGGIIASLRRASKRCRRLPSGDTATAGDYAALSFMQPWRDGEIRLLKAASMPATLTGEQGSRPSTVSNVKRECFPSHKASDARGAGKVHATFRYFWALRQEPGRP